VALRRIPVHKLLRSSCRGGAPASCVAAMWGLWLCWVVRGGIRRPV